MRRILGASALVMAAVALGACSSVEECKPDCGGARPLRQDSGFASDPYNELVVIPRDATGSGVVSKQVGPNVGGVPFFGSTMFGGRIQNVLDGGDAYFSGSRQVEAEKRSAARADLRHSARREERSADEPAVIARPTEGSLLARTSAGKTLGAFPLRHTDVSADIAGFLAATRVSQTFQNPWKDPIEAVYVFPLPETAAVNDFLMVVGERRIRGIVRPRAEAERIYADARARGMTASLLTQERPNIFTQNVANIAPGGEVKIEITYFHNLRYESGEYTYFFPMVVGPRFIPGQAAASGGETVVEPLADPSGRVGGGGTEPDTDRVPDASRITPPVLREGQRSGHDIAVSVNLEAGVPLGEVVVPTHACKVERLADSKAQVTLEDRDSIPNRDFVLRFRVAGDQPHVGFIAHRVREGGRSGLTESGFFTLMLQPQLDPRDADVTPREVTFLIDISGSQQGVPLLMCKNIVKLCLDKLRPEDRFNVMYFESGSGQCFDAPVARTRKNVDRAKEFVESLSSGGGTNMLEGLSRALHEKRDPKYMGMVVFFTDGFIGNDQEILRLVKEEHGKTRVFVFGTGSSVNRSLLEGIAEHGEGKVQYALPRDTEYADRCVKTFFEAIDSPVLCDVEVDWGGLPVSQVYPSKVKDLFAGQPIVLTGRYAEGASGTVTVRGRVGARRVALPTKVDLPSHEPRYPALAPVWARTRIQELTETMVGASPTTAKEIEHAITDIAVDFRLVSAFTSFVAVDESRVVSNGKPLRVLQPVELPEDVSREGALGHDAVGSAVHVDAWGLTLVEAANGNVVVVGTAGASTGKVAKGSVLASCDSVAIRGLKHLESLVLQGGATVTLGFRAGDKPADAPADVRFPSP